MKTETKHTHTQGPWNVDLAKNNAHLASIYHEAESPFLERPWNVAICTGPQSQSNARLIAAAPDLLAVLKNLVFHTSHFIHGDEKDGAIVANELRNAVFAIHKAEGNA